jgi:hypothetical protein
MLGGIAPTVLIFICAVISALTKIVRSIARLYSFPLLLIVSNAWVISDVSIFVFGKSISNLNGLIEELMDTTRRAHFDA